MHVLLADGQSKVRYALRVLLEQQTAVKVVSEAADAQALLELAKCSPPDLALLAWGLPGMGMVDLLATVREVCPRIYLVVLSERQEHRRAALQAGADAFVSKANPPERLLAVLEGYWRDLGVGIPAPSEIQLDKRRLKNNEIPI